MSSTKKLKIPLWHKGFLRKTYKKVPKSRNKINLFKKNTAIGRHYLYDNTNMYITDKELQCLFQLSIGKTHKEIGKTLNISPKTVRCHIDAVKLKTNIDCKHTLINTLLKMNLFAYTDL